MSKRILGICIDLDELEKSVDADLALKFQKNSDGTYSLWCARGFYDLDINWQKLKDSKFMSIEDDSDGR